MRLAYRHMRGIRSPLTPGPHGRRKDNTLPSALSSAPRHHKLLRTLGLAALPVALAGLLAGCGSSHSSGTAADPATATPLQAGRGPLARAPRGRLPDLAGLGQLADGPAAAWPSASWPSPARSG